MKTNLEKEADAKFSSLTIQYPTVNTVSAGISFSCKFGKNDEGVLESTSRGNFVEQ